jgi:isopropylmalate/homocitrate/citramalate synthase
VKNVKQRVPKGTRLEAHFHMDFGMGIANTIMAVAEGVDVIHSTILGLGERAGNVPMEETALALRTMYGIDTGLKFDKFYKLARLAQKLAQINVPLNRPVVGEWLFKIESGIIATWFSNAGQEHLTEVFPYRPELVGQPAPEAWLGKGSGIDSVKIWLKKFNIQANDDEAMKVVVEIKKVSLDKKGLLTEQEFKDAVARVLPGKMASAARR